MCDSNRKSDHLNLALMAQVDVKSQDLRFSYEPLFNAHPEVGPKALKFLGKEMKAPFWVSSMTGGTEQAGKINRNLAAMVAEFGLGMGLGSCRLLLEQDKYFDDFNLRPILGDDRPFYSNLGIAQIEQLLQSKQIEKVIDLNHRLKTDGLIIHINPLQEWLQPEGDRLKYPPIKTLSEFLKIFPFRVIVKEVGQGMGPKSLEALIRLPIAAIEFGAFGGTNFSRLEIQRSGQNHLLDLARVGHNPQEMVALVKNLLNSVGSNALCKEFIISGGVNSFTDAFFLRESLGPFSIVGMAKAFLEKASDYPSLNSFTRQLIEGYSLCEHFLEIKN